MNSTAPTYSDSCDMLASYPLPLAFVDLDRLEANGRAMAERAGGMPIRVATKSVRSVGVLRHILQQVPGTRGLMCYSAAEAAYLYGHGFDDLLIAYPSVVAEDIKAACESIRRGATITFMVDSEAHLKLLQHHASEQKLSLRICFDLDVSERLPGLHFGVQRSPLRTGAAAVALYRQLTDYPGLSLVGVMAYEAQIAGVPDNVPGQKLRNQVIRKLKTYSAPRIARRRKATVAALEDAGAQLEFVNGGGTGSLHTTSLDPVVTEVAAGSGFYSPCQFDQYQDFHHQPAAGFALAVNRIPGRRLVTCSGGGYIASGVAGPDKMPRPWLPDDAKLTGTEGAGEVQTPLRTRYPLQPGDPVVFRHNKAGELCEHFNRLWLIRDGKVLDSVTTYRGDGQCFL